MKENNRYFQIYLKSGIVLTFYNKCNKIDYFDSRICVFKHEYYDGSYETLGLAPYESIDYIMKYGEPNL